ncbi:alpha-1,2-fucosyltransferase [Macellibacteroides sp. HH-ZS]|nr:alpha-1,2-fucosyltransferase [Macellibacteroides sp. HH-ZS]
MKIVNVIGGLGNQMFQCAFAIALRETNHDEVKLDTSHFNGYGLHNGFEIKTIFDYPLEIACKEELKKLTYYIPNYKLSRIARRILPKRKTEYLEPYQLSYLYDHNALSIKGDCYFEGYWMCADFFTFCKDKIIEAFKFKPFSTDINKEYAKLLASENSITIHIRRGDYLTAKNFVNICTLDYYRKAITKAKTKIANPEFFIFSNDQEWCIENLKEEFRNATVHFVANNKGKESYRDMQLMSLARCNILANSSFSWWGAFLNNRKNQIVYVPHRWVNNLDDRDAYADNWIKIE